MYTTSQETEYYILSLKWTRGPDEMVTWWRPENKGYCWHLDQAGRYSEAEVAAHLDYYNSGYATAAVPCDVVDTLAIERKLELEDGKVYRGMMRTEENLRTLLGAAPFPFTAPQHAEGKVAKILKVIGRATAPEVDAATFVRNTRAKDQTLRPENARVGAPTRAEAAEGIESGRRLLGDTGSDWDALLVAQAASLGHTFAARVYDPKTDQTYAKRSGTQSSVMQDLEAYLDRSGRDGKEVRCFQPIDGGRWDQVTLQEFQAPTL